jgi:stage III sporulation protein AF
MFMWEWVRNWVIGIVAAVVIFSLVEIIMPQGDMKKVARMVVGLMMMGVVLSPMLHLLTGDARIQEGVGNYIDAMEREERANVWQNKSYTDIVWEVYERQPTNINVIEDENTTTSPEEAGL